MAYWDTYMNWAILNVINTTCFFKAMKSQNVCGEKGLLPPAFEGIRIMLKGLWMGWSKILKSTGYEYNGCIDELFDWNDVVSNTSVKESLRKSKVFPRERKNEWKWLSCVQMFTWIKKKLKKLQTLSLRVHHGWNDVHQTIKSKKVTIFSVALYPRCSVG